MTGSRNAVARVRCSTVWTYGPFNTLLSTVFPPADNYQVSPSHKRITGSMDFNVIYIVMKRKVPVLFIEIKTYRAFDRPSSRKEASNAWQVSGFFRRYRDSEIVRHPKRLGYSVLRLLRHVWNSVADPSPYSSTSCHCQRHRAPGEMDLWCQGTRRRGEVDGNCYRNQEDGSWS